MEYVFGFMIVLLLAHIRVLRRVSTFNEWLYSLGEELDQLNERLPQEESRVMQEYRRIVREEHSDE